MVAEETAAGLEIRWRDDALGLRVVVDEQGVARLAHLAATAGAPATARLQRRSWSRRRDRELAGERAWVDRPAPLGRRRGWERPKLVREALLRIGRRQPHALRRPHRARRRPMVRTRSLARGHFHRAPGNVSPTRSSVAGVPYAAGSAMTNGGRNRR